MERNRSGAPFNSGIIVSDHGDITLYYRKMHPWVPFELGNLATWAFLSAMDRRDRNLH